MEIMHPKPIKIKLKAAPTRSKRDDDRLNICHRLQANTNWDDTCFASACSFAGSHQLNTDSFGLYSQIVAKMAGQHSQGGIAETNNYKFGVWYNDIDNTNNYQYAWMIITSTTFDVIKQHFYYDDCGYLCKKHVKDELFHVLYIKNVFENGAATYCSQRNQIGFYLKNEIMDFVKVECIKHNGYNPYPLCSRGKAAASQHWIMQQYIDAIMSDAIEVHHNVILASRDNTQKFMDYYDDKLTSGDRLYNIFNVVLSCLPIYLYHIHMELFCIMHAIKASAKHEATTSMIEKEKKRKIFGCKLYVNLDKEQRKLFQDIIYRFLGIYWFEKKQKKENKWVFTWPSQQHRIHYERYCEESIYNYLFVVEMKRRRTKQQQPSPKQIEDYYQIVPVNANANGSNNCHNSSNLEATSCYLDWKCILFLFILLMISLVKSDLNGINSVNIKYNECDYDNNMGLNMIERDNNFELNIMDNIEYYDFNGDGDRNEDDISINIIYSSLKSSNKELISSSNQATKQPSRFPLKSTSKNSYISPSSNPNKAPTSNPTDNPIVYENPSSNPSITPSKSPFKTYTTSPSNNPSILSCNNPTITPSKTPTKTPSISSSNNPSTIPSISPSNISISSVISSYALRITPINMEETHRSLCDSLMIVKKCIQNNDIVGGGGGIEMELSKYLRNYSRTIRDKSQLIISSYSRGLQVIPRQLAHNAGLDSTDGINQLRY